MSSLYTLHLLKMYFPQYKYMTFMYSYHSIYDVKKILCHFKATDTNHDLFVTAGELKKRFEDFKYDITPNGLAEFIKEGDIDVVNNKFSYHDKEFMMSVS